MRVGTFMANPFITFYEQSPEKKVAPKLPLRTCKGVLNVGWGASAVMV